MIETLSIAEIGTSLGIIALLYRSFFLKIEKPNIEQDKQLAELKANVSALCEDNKLIKKNHLPHIEASVGRMENRMTKIETILDERLPKK